MLVEGAGSAAEINLRENDIANMGFARAAASRSCWSATSIAAAYRSDRRHQGRARAGGRRDDRRLPRQQVSRRRDPVRRRVRIEALTRWPSFGLLPFFAYAGRLPRRCVGLAAPTRERRHRIVVPRLPHIANFDDLDPLRSSPRSACVRPPGEPLPPGDLSCCPAARRPSPISPPARAGLGHRPFGHARRGGVFRHLRRISDARPLRPPTPKGRRAAGRSTGSACSASTPCSGAKSPLPQVMAFASRRRAVLRLRDHIGETSGPVRRPAARFSDGREDGAFHRAATCGAYVHGLFGDDRQRAAWLAISDRASESPTIPIDRTLDELAEQFLERHLRIPTRCWRLPDRSLQPRARGPPQAAANKRR